LVGVKKTRIRPWALDRSAWAELPPTCWHNKIADQPRRKAQQTKKRAVSS
jgi:hypothetical protein